MRFSGTRELEKLYKEFGEIGYNSPFSYTDLIRKLREDNKYIATLRVDIDILDIYTINIVFYDRYPKIYLILQFTSGSKLY